MASRLTPLDSFRYPGLCVGFRGEWSWFRQACCRARVRAIARRPANWQRKQTTQRPPTTPTTWTRSTLRNASLPTRPQVKLEGPPCLNSLGGSSCNQTKPRAPTATSTWPHRHGQNRTLKQPGYQNSPHPSTWKVLLKSATGTTTLKLIACFEITLQELSSRSTSGTRRGS